MSTSLLRSAFILTAGATLGAGVTGALPGSSHAESTATTQPAEPPTKTARVQSSTTSRTTNRAARSTARGPLAPTTYNPSLSLAPLVEELGPAVVHIRVAQTVGREDIPRHMRPFIDPEQLDQYRMQQGEGTGFFISADGYLLTNNHVVSGADEVTVTLLDERTFAARLVGTDSNTDIALVKVDSDEPLPFVQLGSSDAARVGDRVVAIGNPFGLSHTVTEGILSAKGRVIGAGPYDDFLQTDASINPGNSGGPLFNLEGEVVGINTAINPRGQGIGFSVPIDMVRPLIDDLKDDGRVSRGWMGVSLQDLATTASGPGERSDIHGTVVGQVYPGTPADDAGLRPGDLIVGLDGTTVDGSAMLVRRVGMRAPGERIKLNVLRDGKEVNVSVRLGERPQREELEGRRR